MELIHVDQAKCVRCGLCSKVCPVGIIHMTGQGPYYQGGHCIVCGHCVAVCPTAALDHRRAPLANQLPLPKQPVLNADTAACFLRARRSIRVYKDMRVPRQQIAELLNIARFAPTAGNTQGVSYYIFDQPETLRQVTALIIAWMETEISNVSPWAPYYTGPVEKYRQTGYDIILRGAPCLVVATAAKKFLERGRDNTHFSLAYAELYAPAIGLGTCWAGFFEACAASGYQPLLDLLALPEHLGVTGGLMVGYPEYRYQRLADRNPLQITWQ